MNETERAALSERIRNMEVTPPPAPWQEKNVWGVGGLLDIGFDEDSELLMVISSTGRGIFDCNTGEKIFRDYTQPDDSWYYENRLLADGVGPLQGKTIRISGINGGGLVNHSKSNHWGMAIEHNPWSIVNVFLTPPWSTIYDKDAKFWKIYRDYDGLRACGFSYTGKSLIIADSADLWIYGYAE